MDQQLALVVEKINQKNELEKKKRELLQKLQKRNDEVNSLQIQQQQIQEQIDYHQGEERDQILQQINEIKLNFEFIYTLKNNELGELLQQNNTFSNQRSQLSDYLHDRKESHQIKQEDQKESLLNDMNAIRNMELSVL